MAIVIVKIAVKDMSMLLMNLAFQSCFLRLFQFSRTWIVKTGADKLFELRSLKYNCLYAPVHVVTSLIRRLHNSV